MRRRDRVERMAGDEGDVADAGLAESGGTFTGLRPDIAGAPFPVIRLDRHRRPAAGGEPAPGRPAAVRVLLIDDDEEDALLVEELLAQAEGVRFRLERAGDAGRGFAKMLADRPDVCLVDHRLPGGDGLGLVRLAARHGVGTPLILLTGQGAPDLDVSAIEAGAADFLDKEHLDVERLERTILLALARGRRAAPAGPVATSSTGGSGAGERLLGDRLHAALARARRERGLGALIVLGPDAPEQPRVLRDALAARLRASDGVVDLGGGRLGVVLERLGSTAHAATVAEKLLEGVAGAPPARPWDRNGPSSTAATVASAGVALFPADADRPALLLALAEAARARAVAAGGGRWAFHDRGAEDPARTRLALGRELRRAIERDALRLRFQPQVTLCSPRLALAAVVRWRPARGGVLEGRPLREIAEAADLLDALGDWTTSAACRQARRWLDEGLSLHVAVPVLSRRGLAWSDLPERLGRQLAAARLPPDRLELEIPERLALDEIERGGGALEALRALGVRLAVEGFGSGPTALAILRDAPLATVKLARALLHGARGAPFAAAVIQLARQLGLRVVAEGVEGQDQLHLLRAQGCDAVQSLTSCPPLPPAACADWLRQATARG